MLPALINIPCLRHMLLFLFVLCVRLGAVAISNTSIHWVYMHYHKTGHDLAIHFGSHVFEANPHCQVRNVRVRDPSISTLTNNDIVVLARGEYTWRNTFFLDNHHFRIAHFARDPYDMILSGYLYHGEIPIPKNELWLKETTFHPCEHNMELIKKYYLVHLLEFIHNSFDLTKAVENVFSLCRRITLTYPAATYSESLKLIREKNVYDAVRLEACRSIRDILLMGANAYQENQITLNGTNPFVSSRRVYTSEFPALHRDVFQKSTETFFDFLLSDSDKYSHPFYECLSKREMVNAAMAAAFSDVNMTALENDSVQTGRNKHITSNLMSPEERQILIDKLKRDEVLSPVLDTVRAVLFERSFSDALQQRYSRLDLRRVKMNISPNNNAHNPTIIKHPSGSSNKPE